MLWRNFNLLGEEKGLLLILTIKEQSIEEVFENCIRVGILTKVIEQQISRDNLKDIFEKNASTTQELTFENADGTPLDISSALSGTSSPSDISNASLDSFTKTPFQESCCVQSIPGENAAFKSSGSHNIESNVDIPIPGEKASSLLHSRSNSDSEKNTTASSFPLSSFHDHTQDFVNSSPSTTTSSSYSNSPSDEEGNIWEEVESSSSSLSSFSDHILNDTNNYSATACDTSSCNEKSKLVEGSLTTAFGNTRTSDFVGVSSIPAKNTDSGTSVYYDAVELLSSDSSPDYPDDPSLIEKHAEAIVQHVFATVSGTLRFSDGATQHAVSDSTNDAELKKDRVGKVVHFPRDFAGLEFASSEVKLPNGNKFRSSSQLLISASVPSCLPEDPCGSVKSTGRTPTRSSQSSPTNIPDTQIPHENMEVEENQTFAGQDESAVGDTGNAAAKIMTDPTVAEDNDETETSKTKEPKPNKLFVRNINYRTSQPKLWSFFANFGDVKHVTVVRDFRTKKSKGYGYVLFGSAEDGRKVLSMSPDELVLDDRKLLCSAARSKSDVDRLRQEADRKMEIVDVAAHSSSSSEYQSANSEISSPLQDDAMAGENYINNLTDNTMLQIFTYLNVRERIQFERVCRRWQALLIRSWMSVKKISFENTVRKFGGMSDMKFQHIMKRTRNVQSLDISHVTKMLSDRAADIIGHHCPNIVTLDISGLPIGSKRLKELADKCTRLQHIKLNNCYTVGEKGLWWLLHGCKSLRHIEVEYNKKITGQCFHLLSPSVEFISLAGSSMVADAGIQRLGDRSHCLTELHLDHCRELSSTAVETLSKKCRMLAKLHLRGCFPKIESQGLVWLGRLHQLEELRVSENLAVADSTLLALAKGCPRLRVLDLTSCHRSVTDAGLEDIAKCTDLQELHISYLHKVHDEGLKCVAIRCNLRKLIARGCGGITDEVMVTLAEHSALEDLDISGNTQLTVKSIQCFADALSANDERSLNILIGGTNVDASQVPSHPHLNIIHRNMCQRHLRQDLELFVHLDMEDNDYEDEYSDFDEEFDEAVYGDRIISGDNWAVSENAVMDLMENDDPLAMEEFEMS